MKHNYSLNMIKTIVFLSFLAVYIIVYFVTTHDKENRIEQTLNQQITNLNNNYLISTNHFNTITKTIGYNIFKNEKVLSIIYEAKHTEDKIKRALLREELYKIMRPQFENIQTLGVKDRKSVV